MSISLDDFAKTLLSSTKKEEKNITKRLAIQNVTKNKIKRKNGIIEQKSEIQNLKDNYDEILSGERDSNKAVINFLSKYIDYIKKNTSQVKKKLIFS